MAKVDTRYSLVDTQPAYDALVEFKTPGLAAEVYPFLKFKLLAEARKLAQDAKHIQEQVEQMDAFRKESRKSARRRRK